MSALTILRDDAVALCVALGFKTAGSWNKQRMSKKMADLAEMVEDGAIEVEDDPDDAERLNELLLKIGESKGDVNVVQELPSEEPEDEAEEEEPEDGPEEQDEDAEPVEDAAEPVKPKKKSGKKTKPVEPTEDVAESKPEKIGPSNKEQVWRKYQKATEEQRAKPKDLASEIHPKVPAVKLSTIASWISSWNKGKGLPACAKS